MFYIGLAVGALVATIAGVVIGIKNKTDLQTLYDDLNQLRWIGADEGWDKAIEAVRTEIAGRLKLRKLKEKL